MKKFSYSLDCLLDNYHDWLLPVEHSFQAKKPQSTVAVALWTDAWQTLSRQEFWEANKLLTLCHGLSHPNPAHRGRHSSTLWASHSYA